MSAPPTAKGASRTRRLARLLACALCGLAGCGAAVGVRAAFFPKKTAQNVEVAGHDEHAAPTEGEAEQPPARTRLDTAVRSGDYPLGLKLIHELRTESAHPDPDLTYREALCLEGLGKWAYALEAHRHLSTPDAPFAFQVAAALGTARCHLAAGDADSATAILNECDRAVGHLPRVRAEVLFQRARLALSRVPKPSPGPFAPTAVAWVDVGAAPELYLDWLPLLEWGTSAEAAPPPVSRSSSEEVDPEQTVRAALASDHPGKLGLRLAAANLAFLNDRPEDALREYKRLREDVPHAPEALPAAYNHGLLLLRTWAMPEARKAFTDVIDRGRDTPLGRLAWWWVGRVELDLGNPSDALGPWQRAAGDRETVSAAGLGTVLIHLLDDKPESAEKRLREVKASAADPHGDLAEAFACYLRYDHAPTPTRGVALADAVRTARYGRPLGPAGEYLFGCWLARVGRADDAAAVHDAGADHARGPWGTRMTLAVADHLDRTGHSDAARRRFVAVAANDAGASGDRARVRLADLAAKAGDGAACVRLCRTVLENGREDREAVLRLMGRGYELLDRPRAAAECFAGRPPADPHRDRP